MIKQRLDKEKTELTSKPITSDRSSRLQMIYDILDYIMWMEGGMKE